jgi:hypothetical protein
MGTDDFVAALKEAGVKFFPSYPRNDSLRLDKGLRGGCQGGAVSE